MTTTASPLTPLTPPKPHRTPFSRSPSDPIRPSPSRTTKSPPQQIYVLSADGSSLFLLDPTKPSQHEEPPPYAPYFERGGVPFSRSRERSDDRTLLLHEGAGHVRHRASTMSVLDAPETSTGGPSRARPRYHSSCSTNSVGSLTFRPRHDRARSALSSPDAPITAVMDERTPLLAMSTVQPDEESVAKKPRGLWRSIFCGELAEDDERGGFIVGWKRFWSPLGDGSYWRAMSHLWFFNFPLVCFLLLVTGIKLTVLGCSGVALLGRWDIDGDGTAHHPPARCCYLVVDTVHLAFRCSSRGRHPFHHEKS